MKIGSTALTNCKIGSVQVNEVRIGSTLVWQFSSFDPDAQAFITAAGITDPIQQNAINQLVLDLKGYSIWTKFKALYPFVGGTATTHKFNLKNPLDTDTAFRLVFNGGWTHNSNGITGNGTNTTANTFFYVNTQFTTTNGSFGVYMRNSNSGNTYQMGAGAGGFGIATYGANDCYYMFGHGYSSVSSPTTAGLYITNRTTTNTEGYKNSTRILNVAGSPILPVKILTLGATDPAGGASSIGNYSFCFIANTFIGTEITNLNTAVTTFNTSLSR